MRALLSIMLLALPLVLSGSVNGDQSVRLRGPPNTSNTPKVSPCARTTLNEERARGVLSSQGLLDLEHADPYYPLRSFRWVLLGGREYKGGCAFLMERCHVYEEEETKTGSLSTSAPLISCGSSSTNSLEVVAKSAQGLFSTFEKAFGPLPPSIKVAIGAKDVEEGGEGERFRDESTGRLPSDLFYVELKGESAKAVIKTLAAQYATCGFRAVISAKNVTYGAPKPIKTGEGETVAVGDPAVGDNVSIFSAEPDGKAPFDPTPGRKWKVKDAEFLMNRGPTVEIHDVPPRFLDEDFLFYYQGSGGIVAPWRSCFIREVLEEELGGRKRWVPVDILKHDQAWQSEIRQINGE